MSILSQRSLAGGEIGPSLYSRCDVTKYATAVRTQRNFLTQRHGGAMSRPGSLFVGEVKESVFSGQALIPFKLSPTQSYVLEFGHLSLRFIKNGAYIKEVAKNITGITQANPGVVTSAAHGLASADEIYVSGIVGMTQLNGRNFKVVVLTVNTFTLTDLADVGINTTSYTAYSSGGTFQRIYKVTTTYNINDVHLLKHSQPNFELILTHPSYTNMKLVRISDTSWTLSATGNYNIISESLTLTITNVGAAGATTYKYRFESIDENGFKVNVTDKTTTTGNATLDATNYNQITWPDGSFPFYNIYKQDKNTGIYGFVGFVQKSLGTSGGFLDKGILPDLDAPYTVQRLPFYTESDTEDNTYIKPECSCAFQQRLVLAAPSADPTMIAASRLGYSVVNNGTNDFAIYNFGLDSPITADNAVHMKLAARNSNNIFHMLDLGALVIFTDTGEFVIRGSLNANEVPNLNQASANGCSRNLPPLAVNNSAVYVQARSGTIRDLGFEFDSDNFNGTDLTLFAPHLFENHTIAKWTYQQFPHSVLWVVRDDGVLLSLTYIKDQQIWAWARHDTGRPTGTISSSGHDTGECFYEDACSIPEGDEDVVYVIVRRPDLNGTFRYARYVERLSLVRKEDVIDETCLDSYLSYDGRGINYNMTISGGTNWTYNEALTLTAGSSYFIAGDVGNEIRLHYFETNATSGDYEEHEIRLRIIGYTSATVVTVNANKTVPVALRGVAVTGASGNVDKAVDEVSGLFHLEGYKVSVLADGYVVGNPYNPNTTVYTVTNGSITLDRPYAVIHVGIPIISDIETLDIDTVDGETISDKKSIVTSVAVRVEKTRGLFAGGKPPPYPKINALDGLSEFRVREYETYEEPIEQKNEVLEVPIDNTYTSGGRTFLRNVDPLPVTILSIHPSGMFPFQRRGGG